MFCAFCVCVCVVFLFVCVLFVLFVCCFVFLLGLDNKTELILFFLSLTRCACQSSEEKYVKNVYQWMIPFLHRCENQCPGLANSLFKEYLVTLAKEDLTLPLKIFQNSKPAVSIEPC